MINTTSVYGIYIDDHKALLIKDSSSRLWGFPGGKMEVDETELEALRREFLEEVGANSVEINKLVHTSIDNDKIRMFYRISKLSGPLNFGGNSVDVKSATLLSITELHNRNLASGVLELCQKYI